MRTNSGAQLRAVEQFEGESSTEPASARPLHPLRFMAAWYLALMATLVILGLFLPTWGLLVAAIVATVATVAFAIRGVHLAHLGPPKTR